MDQQKLTIIEILVVVAIIALVGTLSFIAVGTARSKQRDATRLSNVRQIQSALEDYFNENNAYPTGERLPLGDSTQSACFGITGFQADCSAETETLMRMVPRAYESGLKGLVVCGNPARNAFCYSALSESAAYGIEFELENALPEARLQKGVNCASPGKMAAGTCQ